MASEVQRCATNDT